MSLNIFKSIKHASFSFFKEAISLTFLAVKKILNNNNDKILSVYFHNPSPEIFESAIRYMAGKSYSFLSVSSFEKILNNATTPDSPFAIITIDDGFRDNIGLLEVINRYGVPVTIFVTSSAIEEGNFWFEYVIASRDKPSAVLFDEIVRIKRMPAEDYYSRISELKRSRRLERSALTIEELVNISREEYITIGSHSVSHISLPGKSVEVQRKELTESKKILEYWTRKEVDYFSYPSGDFGEEQRRIVRECGYRLAFSTETKPIDIEKVDRFSIPKRCVNDDAGYFETLAKISGAWDYFMKR